MRVLLKNPNVNITQALTGWYSAPVLSNRLLTGSKFERKYVPTKASPYNKPLMRIVPSHKMVGGNRFLIILI